MSEPDRLSSGLLFAEGNSIYLNTTALEMTFGGASGGGLRIPSLPPMGFEPTKINPLGDFSKWFDDADNFGPKVGVEGILGPRIFIATSVGHPGWLFKHFCARFYKKATPIGHSGVALVEFTR